MGGRWTRLLALLGAKIEQTRQHNQNTSDPKIRLIFKICSVVSPEICVFNPKTRTTHILKQPSEKQKKTKKKNIHTCTRGCTPAWCKLTHRQHQTKRHTNPWDRSGSRSPTKLKPKQRDILFPGKQHHSTPHCWEQSLNTSTNVHWHTHTHTICSSYTASHVSLGCPCVCTSSGLCMCLRLESCVHACICVCVKKHRSARGRKKGRKRRRNREIVGRRESRW